MLVTGGAGAIGGNLVRALAGFDTKKIIVLDNLSSSYRWNMPRSNQRSGSSAVTSWNDEHLRWAFKDKPDIVYHLAAHFANQNSVDNPEENLMVNGIGILKVLQYAHLVNVERFVYSSSGCGIYGLESKMPFEEHDVSIHLHTPYQVTKLLGRTLYQLFPQSLQPAHR